MSKRILSLVLTLALVLGSFSMAFADHAENILTAEQKIDKLKEMGFVKGKDVGGNLDLVSPIKRSETATIVTKALLSGGDMNMEEVEAEIEKSRYTSAFSDVSLNSWYNPYINIASQEQLVKGYPNGEFRPERDIRYSEVITMMVRVLDEEPNAGRWPDNYIGKARQLGLLEGIDKDYTGQADREGVFVLLYNTLVNKGIGNYNIDKVLVLENNRVESIGANEIVVEVIKEVQRADFVKESRRDSDKEARRGEQLRITLNDPKVGEVEDLLGRVIDLSYDKMNKAVAIKLDNTYEYKAGKVELSEKALKIEGKTYTVQKDEQYKNSEERIFNTYVNNEALTYDNAYKNVGKLDFARVTIKNGKVLFIDGFAFEDIAPVKEVKEIGNKTQVIVYNDVNDGGEKRIELEKENIVSFKDGAFHRMDRKDITKLDVIHVSKEIKGKKAVVVRQDAQVNGTYDKVIERKDETVVVVDGVEYEILTQEYKMPVYSPDSKEFFTLRASEASRVLKGFQKEKVTILKDVNGDLQYIGGEIEFGEIVGLLDRVVGKEARILKKDDTKSDYSATLNSEFGNVDGTTGHKNLNNFNRGDLVFASVDKENIEKMTLLSPYTQAGDTASVEKELRYVTVDGKVYRVFDRTNVFVRNVDANGNVEIFATSIKNVQKYAGANLKAVVITDKQYADQVDSRYVYDKNTNVAHTIVFRDVNVKKDVTTKVAEITSISNRYEEIEVRYDNGNKEIFAINKSTDAYKALFGSKANNTPRVVVGDIVELSLDKDDLKSLTDIVTIIGVQDSGVKVKSYDSKNKVLRLEGDSTVYYLTSETANFVKGSIEEGKTTVAIKRENIPTVSGEAFVKAIAERSPKTTVQGKGTLEDVYDENGKIVLRVKGTDGRERLFQFLGNAIDVVNVKALKGYSINFTEQSLNGVDYAFEVVKVGDTPVAPTTPVKVIDQISNLPVAANVTVNDRAAIEAARAAYDSLTTAEKALVTNNGRLVEAENALRVIDNNNADLAAAKAVDTLISALPSVNDLKLADKAQVETVRAAYNALTTVQKNLVTKLATLTAAEAKIVELGKTDEKNEITISAKRTEVGIGYILTVNKTGYETAVKYLLKNQDGAPLYKEAVEFTKGTTVIFEQPGDVVTVELYNASGVKIETTTATIK